MHILSKSTFIRGVQCEKSLYFNKFKKEYRDKISENQQAIFTSGTDLGFLAQDLFPNGIDCSPEHYYNWGPSIQKTKELISINQPVIYEAAFEYEGVMAALDILVHKDGKWYGYEVKGSTSVKPTHHDDVSLQFYVINKSGLELEDISLIYLNNKYSKQGELDLNQLFKIESLYEIVNSKIQWVEKNIENFKEVLNMNDAPSKEIGPHCFKPYTCDFKGYCWSNIPEYSVFDLYSAQGKDWELYNRGIIEINDIPDDFKLSKSQQIQVLAEKNNEALINSEEISQFLDSLKYPLYHFDFETFATSVPLFDNSRPFQQLPFQYSLHVQNEINGECEHKEFLAHPENGDPRPLLIEQMIQDLGKTGDVLVYNKTFEDLKIKELIRDFPLYKKELEAIRLRLVDLATPFQKKYYYKKEMKGRYTIKNVLPALCPELSYKNLEIQEGGTASRCFSEMMLGKYRLDVDKTRKDLLAYCELDTLAMVKLLEKLYSVV